MAAVADGRLVWGHVLSTCAGVPIAVAVNFTVARGLTVASRGYTFEINFFASSDQEKVRPISALLGLVPTQQLCLNPDCSCVFAHAMACRSCFTLWALQPASPQQ